MRYSRLFPVAAAVMAMVALACSDGSGDPVPGGATIKESSSEAPSATGAQTALAGTPSPKPLVESPSPTPQASRLDQDEECFPKGSVWKTNFCKHSVPFEEIISAGLPRDRITPVDNPEFVSVDPSPEYMEDDDPVISLEIDGEARAYPLAILIKHEIVNDEIEGIPVTVTYCPLCNSAIVFDRRVDGTVLDFGTTGLLRHSDLIMWDRQTQSWWQQITGEAIVGELTGTKLEFIPAQVVSWTEFRQAFPEGQVLTRDLGLGRTYETPPYIGYEFRESPGLSFETPDPRLPVKERVAGVSIGGQHVAYPFSLLAAHPVINDSIGGSDIVVFYSGGTFSAFAPGITPDFSLQPSRAVGSTGIFEPFVDGRKLTFEADDGRFLDRETSSEWTILGRAIGGPLTGAQLKPIVHGNHFWFAWAGFNPDTEVRSVEDLS